MHLFTDISSHGYGHLAISAPVLNALARLQPDLRLTVRTGLPLDFLKTRIQAPFTHLPEATDFGFMMRDATCVDLEASARAYQAAHADRPARLAAEARLLDSLRPDLVLSNISDLPLAGAALAGIPSAALCSLNWADLFAHFFGHLAWAAPIHHDLLSAYQSVRCFLRCTPAMAMPALPRQCAIPPIAALGRRHPLPEPDSRYVLVAMGGIAHRLPIETWPRQPGLRWIVPAAWGCVHPDAITQESLGLGFTDLLCSIDAVLTKPGYGTFTEAACHGTPVLYQRRADWPEQDALIDWLHQHGRAYCVEEEAVRTGHLSDALSALRAQTAPARPIADGADIAASMLLDLAHPGRSTVSPARAAG